jgi:Flp pilus assembly pilin Flp
MNALLQRLIRDDEGQDIVEYALLTAGIGLAGVAIWPAITMAIGVTYEALDAKTQDLWEVPDPGGV